MEEESLQQQSHPQQEVVLSTTEAEYLAATETCRQLQWVKSLIQELGFSDRIEGATCTNLHVDNQAAISLIKNHNNHKRSKRIALRNFYCREQHKNGKITVDYVPSDLQPADALTKAKSPVMIHWGAELKVVVNRWSVVLSHYWRKAWHVTFG